MIYKLLFPRKPDTAKSSVVLLAARIIFGLLLLSHGVQKLSNFQELSSVFPDPLGVGSTISLGLAVFAEVACSIGVIFGVLYRLALIPMMFTMFIAFYVIHSNDPFNVKELAFVYLIVFVFLFIMGPGKYAIDYFLGKKILKK